MSKRYIEIASGYRNRNNWPCPAQFVVPIDCRNRTEDPLEAHDPLVDSYPSYAWYQVPYAAPFWSLTITPVVTEPRPRKINGIYYTSLWPLSSTLDQKISGIGSNFSPIGPSQYSGWLSPMHFSGGTFDKPILNAAVSSPPNIWQATTGSGNNIIYNPYYTPQKNYFAGALLIRFTENPSCKLNSWNKSQIVTVPTPYPNPIFAGIVIEQTSSGAQGTIICVISDTTFIVTLETTTTPPFDPTGGPIEIIGPPIIPFPVPGTPNPAIGDTRNPGTFTTDTTDAYDYSGTVETSVITSYDGLTGTVTLSSPFSEDFDPNNDYYLIDFNTDPNNDWSNYVSGGPRIFVPGGSSAPQAYEGLYFENYTLSSEANNLDVGSRVIKYDFVRKIAYLDKPLPLKTDPGGLVIPPNHGLYGSNSFTIRKNPPISSKSFDRISACNGSILELSILKGGANYQVGEIIASVANTTYYSSPTVPVLFASNYSFQSQHGFNLRAEIINVDVNGAILKLKILQQGFGFVRTEKYEILPSTTSGSNGTGAILTALNTFQSIEVYRNNNSEFAPILKPGNFVYLPNYGKIGTNGLLVNNNSVAPTIPRYLFPPNSATQNFTIFTNILDIRQSGYPPTVTGCDVHGNVNVPETGIYQVVDSFQKDFTFGNWYTTNIPQPQPISTNNPITVFYLKCPIDVNNGGLDDLGQEAYVPNQDPTIPGYSSSNGYLQNQQIEYLQYSGDNLHPLNFTGTRVSQSQAVCYKIKLISITLPNLPLDNQIGGLISFYPYLYVELSNVNSPMRGNKGIIYSNNPNANRALFKVNVSDTNTPIRSRFIKLRAGGSVQTVKFTPNDDLYFRVYLKDGTLFETQQKDTAPPLPPDFFVQISAQFEIDRVDYPYGKTSSLHLRN